MGIRETALIICNCKERMQKLSALFPRNFIAIYAGDTCEAIKKAGEHLQQIAIVILDYDLPKTDRVELLKQLKKLLYDDIPLLVISQTSKGQLDALQNGARDFIVMTEDDEIICAKINNALGQGILRRNSEAFYEKQELSNLINSIPGGIAIYKIVEDRFETVYFSDGVAALSGHTRAEYAKQIDKDASTILYQEDKKRILDSIIDALKDGKPIDETYRIYHKDGRLVWVRLNGILMGEEDGCPIVHAVFQKPPRMSKLYDKLVNESKDMIYVSDIDNYDLLYMNRAGQKIVGKEETECSGRKCYEYIFGYTKPCPFCKINQMSHNGFYERDFTYSKNGNIYAMRGRLTDWNGLKAHVEYITDVTKVRKAEKKKSEWTERLQAILDNIPGGMCLYEFDGATFSPIIHNKAFYNIFGYTAEHRKEVAKKTDFLNVHPDDIEELKRIIFDSVKNNKRIDHTYRSFHDIKNRYVWIKMSAVIVTQENDSKLCYVSYADVDKLKKIEQELQENQVRYSTAIKSSGINVWEYDIQNDSLYVVSNSSRIKQNCYQIDNYSARTLKDGYVRNDSKERFLSIFERLRAGEKEVCEDIWYKTTDLAGWWCERVIYITIFDDAGRPVKAYGAGRDVTREKDAEKKFYEEISNQKSIQSEMISSVIVDLTENRVLDVTSSFGSVCSFAGASGGIYFSETAKKIVSTEIRGKFIKTFNVESLLSSFNSGEYVVRMEFPRTFDDSKVYWINYGVHLIHNPNTKSIVANISCIDITNERVMQSIMATVAKTDYDSFVVVDGCVDSARSYPVVKGKNLYKENLSFELQNEKRIRQTVVSEDIERVVAECKIENAWAHVKNGATYKFSFGMITDTGEVRRKQIQFSYLDKRRKSYLMSQIDVNDIYEMQEQSKRLLEKALAAKSSFLSNMSHDMRTPMNAIIGFSQMALENCSTEDELRDYMEKINKSGSYLLNLINDVLDMTKIENNKVELNPQPVDFSNLFSGVISSLKPMMDEKNIEFIFETRNFIDGKLAILDKIRMQQIFINLLSNATKFTPNGGKIECIIESLEFDGKFSKERTVIRDNGCGMSKEFLKKACLPFEQEQSNKSYYYGGTGLGLSIVKNLVELMGGTLSISSEIDIGTEITINFTIELVDNPGAKSNLPENKPVNADFFNGKKILLCEDHPLNCEIAKKLLTKKGFTVDIASNGKEGLKKFAESQKDYYSAILMDIRMPQMDGLEATCEIRKLAREDAKAVPIIAMTANAFDDDVKKSLAVGMNAHLAKPVEPQALYKTLEEMLYNEKP